MTNRRNDARDAAKHGQGKRAGKAGEALTSVLNADTDGEATSNAHDVIYREMRAIASRVLGGQGGYVAGDAWADARGAAGGAGNAGNAGNAQSVVGVDGMDGMNGMDGMDGASSRPSRANLTLLVHEAWIKLQRTQRWKSRAHFFGSASNAMRQVLVDEARKRNTHKRRANQARIDPDLLSERTPDLLEDVLAIDEAISRLATEDERAARVAEMKLFGDIPMETIAACLDVTVRTAQRDWRFARAWLADALSKA